MVAIIIGLVGVNFADTAFAQTALWLRNTAISPDGREIAFTYKGDAYIVSASGGAARTLVNQSGHVADLHWSKQGDWIAMSIEVRNNRDVYSVPASGGAIRRLTWHGGEDRPLGFSPDGESVYLNTQQFSSAVATQYSITPVAKLRNQVFSTPVQGGKLTPVLPLPVLQASIDPAGEKIAYAGEFSLEQAYRKHQKSWASPGILIHDIKTGRHERITERRVSALEPLWNADGQTLYYLSEASGDFNIWKYSPASGTHTQITRHEQHPVRDMSISNGNTIAYSYNGELYVLDLDTETSRKLAVTISTSSLPLTGVLSGVTFDEFAVSPAFPEIVAVTWGDMFLLNPINGQSKEMVRTPFEERSVQFTPDGSNILFASERNGNWGIYRVFPAQGASSFLAAETFNVEPVIVGAFDAMQPLISPDGSKIAYLYNRDEIRVFDLRTKKHTTILPGSQNYSYADGDLRFVWSPDSAFLAVDFQETLFNTEIIVYALDGKSPPIRLTYNNAIDTVAAWAPDGGSIYYLSTLLAPYGADGSQNAYDVFQVFLSRKARLAAQGKATIAGDQGDGKQPKKDDGKQNSGTAFLPVDYKAIEVERLAGLTRRLTRQTSGIYFAAPVLDNRFLFHAAASENFDGTQFIAGYLTSMKDGNIEQIFNMPAPPAEQQDVPIFRVSADGRHVFLYDGNGFRKFDLAARSDDSFAAVISFQLALEDHIKAAFDQYWIITRKKFYVADLNGVDWQAYGASYRRFLDHVDDPQDVALILSEMVGELNVSHTGASYTSPRAANWERTMGALGLLYDHAYQGEGMKVDEVIAEGPFDQPDVSIRPGDVIIAIDGEKLPASGGVNRLLTGKADRTVAVRLLRPEDGKEWVEMIETIHYEQEMPLLAERWKKARREFVVEASDGRLGYAYLSAMNESVYREFTAQAIGRFRDAEGLIVDERFNLGGNLHDSIVTFLSGKKYSQISPPGDTPSFEPRSRWFAPSVIIANASSYSDGSVFPQAYRDLQLGQQVGEPVPGTGTAVWWMQSKIIPGLVYGFPQLPLRRLDGTYYENLEIEPDVLSLNDPASIISGQDKQLKEAVQTLLKRIDNR